MTRENFNFLLSQSSQVPLGEFVVARVRPFTDITKKIPYDQVDEIFKGKNDNADLLMGFGIVRQVAEETGNVLMIFNHNQGVTFPDNVMNLD